MARRKDGNLLDALFASANAERERRRKADVFADKAQTLRGMLMPCQVRLEADPARRVSVRSARRNGKSTGVLLIVSIRCLERAEGEWVVIGLTRPSVKRIYWDALKKLNEAFELGIRFQHQELIAYFPNGSKIYFVGAENAAEIEKLRGGKYDGVVIDESKSYSAAVFEELIQDVLEPALMDRAGQLFVIGTPGDVLEGPFFLATCEEPILFKANPKDESTWRLSNAPYGSTPQYPAVWSLHQWTLQDNVTRFEDKHGRTFTLWDEALAIKKDRAWADDHPSWRREYLGHWVANLNKRVYRYRSYINDYVPLADTRWGIPELDDAGNRIEWQTVCGFDFGSKDGSAIVVWAYSPTHPGLWELYSHRKLSTSEEPLHVAAIAAWYREVEAEYGPFQGWPADTAGLATMVIDTLAVEHGVYLEAAEKREKNDHIELFNTDLDRGLIHIRKGSELGEDLRENRWLEKTIGTDKRKEDPATPNDVADAGLYSFRFARHRQAKPITPAMQMGTREWWEKVAADELKTVRERARRAQDGSLDRLDTDWWLS